MPVSAGLKSLFKNETLRNWLIFLPIFIAFIGLRAPGLGRYITVDEARWLQRSANFYVAIANGEWEKTFQSPHPGVITQWAGAAGYLLVFPEYADLGRADARQVFLLGMMEEHGINPMQVLAAGRFVLVLFNAVAVTACWPFAVRLIGRWPSALGFALLALDPFTIAHQRLLHLDGLVTSSMLLCVLAFVDYLKNGNWHSLLTSGIAAGLAWLTKTPSWFLVPFIVVLTSLFAIQERRKPVQRVVSLWWALVLWGGVSFAVVFLLFPAMWTNPIGIPLEMFRFSTGQAEGEYGGYFFFNGVVYPEGDPGWLFYPSSFLWRNTPITVLGFIAASWLLLRFYLRKGEVVNGERLAIWILIGFAFAFELFLNISTKKVDRYLLPAHAPLIFVAAWGWLGLLISVKQLKSLTWVAAAGLIVLQAISGLPTFPYYLSYYSPLMGGSAKAPKAMMIGQGEGLEQAVNYLKEQGAEDIASFYNGTYNRFLYRQTISIIPSRPQLTDKQLEQMLAKEYIVIYILQWQRGLPANLLAALEPLEPEFSAWNNGLEYVRVYHLNER